MNILQIDEQCGWRGGEQQASYLIHFLAREGHRVFVAGRPGSPFLQSDHGTEPLDKGLQPLVRISAPFFTEFDLFTALRLAWTVRMNRIDILHAHTSHAHTMACLARAFAGRGKVVVSRRVDFPPKGGALNLWKYSMPDKIVAVSSFIAKVMRAYGIDESRLAVVHSGTDASRFDVPPIARADLGVPDGVPLLGNVAALAGHKDHETLLNAMPAVLRALPGLRLLLIGEGALRGPIESQIRRLNLAQSVKLLGHRNDVPRVLKALDAFVLSSKEEGFGGAALEAMACGLPVVSTDAGGMSDTVVHERTGLLVPIRNPEALAAAIIRVFRDNELVQHLKSNLQAQVENFSVQRMTEGNLAVYEDLMR